MTLPLKILRTTSSEYTKSVDNWNRWQALFFGGEALAPYITRFLPKQPIEPKESYTYRTQNAWVGYENHLANIISTKDNALFSFPFAIRATDTSGNELPEEDIFYSAFKEDCSGTGQDLLDFMRARFVESLVFGQSYWLIQGNPEQDYQHLAEWEEANGPGTVKICPLSCFNLLDWQLSKGELEWATVWDKECYRESPQSTKRLVRETWRIFDREDVATYELLYPEDKPPKDTVAVPEIERVKHGFDGVPIMALRMPHQYTVCPLAGDLQVRHFKRSYALDWAMDRSCYPVGVLSSSNAVERGDTEGYFFHLAPGESFQWATPDAASFEQQNTRIRYITEQIYKVCCITDQILDTTHNGAVARSGTSKTVDAAQSERSLNRCGEIIREAVQTTFQWISSSRGEDLKWDVSGLDRFAIALQGNTIQDIQAGYQDLKESPTAILELRVQESERLLPGIPRHQKVKIAQELAKAPPPPPETLIPSGESTQPPDTGEESKGQAKPSGMPRQQ